MQIKPFDIIEKIPVENLQEVEQQYLNWMNIMPGGWFYNISKDATAPMINRKHTLETKQKMSLKKIGKYVGEKCNMYGKRGNKHHFYGKHQSEEVKKKISEIRKDKNIYSFKNRITGEIFTGSRHGFYKQHNLNVSNVCDIIKGKAKSHRDWIMI